MLLDNTILLPLLLIAHLLADFSFQPDLWVKEKKEKGFKSKYLLYHVLLHTAFYIIIIAIFDWTKIHYAVLLGVLHWLIDSIKGLFKQYKSRAFILDQVFHLLTILGVTSLVLDGGNSFIEFGKNVLTYKNLMIAAAYYIVYQPMSFFMQIATSRWHEAMKMEDLGLKDAGKWIGRLERILILTFIISSNFSAIGFLIAAKSVFRFGDLNNPTNQMRTEYILIGTLISFSITIFLGLFLLMMIQ